MFDITRDDRLTAELEPFHIFDTAGMSAKVDLTPVAGSSVCFPNGCPATPFSQRRLFRPSRPFLGPI
jgi:hypothetical protein